MNELKVFWSEQTAAVGTDRVNSGFVEKVKQVPSVQAIKQH